MSESINALEELDTKKVSLVHRGAQRKKFAMFKSEDSSDGLTGETLKACIDIPLEDEDSVIDVLKSSGFSDKAGAAALGAIRLINAFGDEFTHDGLSKVSEILGVKKGEPKMAEKEKEVVADEAVVKAADVNDEIKESIAKAEERANEAEKRLEEITKALNAERDERVLREYVAKSKDEYSHIPGKAEDLGALLRDLHTSSPELCSKVEGVLKSADELLATSGAFSPAGTSNENDAGSDAYSKLKALADSLIEKSKTPMTPAQAFSKALSQAPELYEQYRAGN